MSRIFVTVLAVLLILSGMAAASDLHIEASFGDHANFEQSTDNDKSPDGNGHCGCCCHGSAHYVSLPLAESGIMSLPCAALSPHNDNLLTSLPLAPPTHPPKV